MDQVTITGAITPLLITIAWDPLTTSDSDTGRDPVLFYQLQWKQQSASTWVTLTTTTPDISSFAVTSGFLLNTNYNIQVAAINGVGLGAYSTALTILTDNVPVRMNTPVEDSSTNATMISISWTGITLDDDTGRDPVIYYKLEWNQGSAINSWKELSTPGTVIYGYTQSQANDGIQNGTSYQYRVTPKNLAGFGATSAILTVIPSSPPDQMVAPATQISPDTNTSVRITWTAPAANGAVISSYLIQIKARTGNTYSAYTASCDGTQSTIVSQKWCDIPMSAFLASPYNLQKGDNIYVRVKAANLKGFNSSYSPDSPGNTVTAETVPVACGTPTRVSASSTQLQVQWSQITGQSNIGGPTATILSYQIQRDQGNWTSSQVWTDIQGLSPFNTATTATTSTGIVTGMVYQLRCRAYNKYGWGPWSSTQGSARIANVPTMPSSVTTANFSTSVKVTWTAAATNGAWVTKYFIEIQKKGTSNWATTTECDGSQSTIVNNLSCQILMTTLTAASTFNYAYGDTPLFRVSAYNLEGWSSSQKQSSGVATIQTAPLAPSVAITNNPANTNEFQIQIYWTAITGLSNWRGYIVHQYEIQWCDFAGLYSYETIYNDTMPFVLTFTQQNSSSNPQVGNTAYPTRPVVGGTKYKFKYRAYNIFGPGPWSVESQFYASTVPDQLAAATTSLSGASVIIQWLPTPNDHMTAVGSYRVKLLNKAGTLVEDATICNGTKNAVSMKCTTAMSTITNNLNLGINDLIVVQVEALNIMGYSIPSPSNTLGVTAKKLPQTAPTNLFRGTETGKYQIQINWQGLSADADTGGQAVDYIIQYDKNSNGVNWYNLTTSTNGLTTYTDTVNFQNGTGKNFQFKIAAFNDFGVGPFSSAFGLWVAISPSGLTDPTTTLNLLTYVDEDDIIVIKWNYPGEDGGLSPSYKVEVLQGNGIWAQVDYNNECAERATITNYFLPQATSAANALIQCTMLVSTLTTKYLLNPGNTVLARITAYQTIGSTTSTMTGTGTAVIPTPQCFRTTFPRIIGGSVGPSSITATDIDSLGNIVVGGYSQDSNLLNLTTSQTLPVVTYIAKGNYYVWGKYIQTTDGTTSNIFNTVLDIAFRSDNQKIALSLDLNSYSNAFTIVVLNFDGSYYGSFKESTNLKGKVNITSLIYDSSNFITMALDISQDGTSLKKYAGIIRFSLGNPTASSITPSLYLLGGAAGKNSQAYALKRIISDPTSIYASAFLQDASSNRRALLAKITLATGSVSKYFYYQTNLMGADYNTDKSIAVIKRMNLYEDDISTLQIISACIISNDGYRPHFGQFIFSTAQTQTILIPDQKFNWYCLGIYQKILNVAYVLYEDTSSATSAGYMLYYGRIDYLNRIITAIPIANHDSGNNYYGAIFVHQAKIYYFGDTQNLITSTSYPFGQRVGFINLYDQQDTFSCINPSQNFNNFGGANAITITLVQINTANMNWMSTLLSSGPSFSPQTGKSMKALTLSGGIFNINFNEPLMNNTWCPIVTNPAPPQISPPVIASQTLLFNPDASSYPPQTITFSEFVLSKTCPDQIFYYSSFLSDTSQPLPSLITFDPLNTKYSFAINNLNQVGMYYIMLQSTIGNNKTTSIGFTVQVYSPCLNIGVNVPTLGSIPTYDISDLVPLYVNLNWDTVNPSTPSCGPIFFIFQMLNATTGGSVDTSVFSLVNITGNGIQQIKVQTSAIPAAKLWTDIQIKGRLQGDLVKTYVYSIKITNKCNATQIIPVPISDVTYYTGRDPIDFTFIWSETIGVCGPISYSANQFLISNTLSNNSLDSGVFQYPGPTGVNNTLRIYTWDDTKVGSYKVRVFASLGVGGFQQSNTLFNVQIIKDPCSYYPYFTSSVNDLTLWINQTNQIINIPPFYMNDTLWVCNFSYSITTQAGGALDPIFVVKQIANEGDGTNITLVTSDITKTTLSPYTIKVSGWPKRQNTTSQSFSFRVFIAYLNKEDCSSGYYYDKPTETCIPCVSPCSTCKSATQCTWCNPGYTYFESNNSCILSTLSNCPPGTKDPVLNFCRQCSQFCSACTDMNTCTQCLTGYNLANGQCYQANFCPAGYRNDDVLGCVKCPTNCSNCNSNGCSFCMEGSFLNAQTQTCVPTCPIGYYGDPTSKSCMICQPSCKTCVTNNYTCTSCKDVGSTKYYLFGSTCVTRCPYLQYFQNEQNRSCDACNPLCKICVNAFDDCIVCNQGSVISGRACMNKCLDKQYITSTGTCFPCDPACFKCYGAQNSMCTQCVEGQYLTQTTCEKKCNPPLFAYNSTSNGQIAGVCSSCPYYCNDCQMANTCNKCKTGYAVITQDCQGEYFLRLNNTQSVNATINTALVPNGFNPTQLAFEFWFKADNIMSVPAQVLIGLAPYKMRKKAATAQIQFNYFLSPNELNYCDSTNLQSNQWYHFGLSMSETTNSLYCYLDGSSLNIGTTSLVPLLSDILSFTEIVFGNSSIIKASETRFTGYIKEFRWWSNTRTQFQFINFKNVAITDLANINPPNPLLAYWKLDEKNTDPKFVDYASGGTVSFDPTTINMTLNNLVEMREIYLKLCPEGTFVFYNETAGYYNCTPCDPACKNCNGNSSQNCTSCNPPFKLLQNIQQCVISETCPLGFWIDGNKNCWPCHPYCTECYGSDQFQCTACGKGYFKAYKKSGCVSFCPLGLYGNIATQSCGANPIVTSLYPADGSIFPYGSFIDLEATYTILNEEPRETFWYGWIVTQLNSDINIAQDACKPYANTDILRVHLDNNILVPNNYYNITFYVQGNRTIYNGMFGSMYNVIYIGIPPKGGECIADPQQGIAQVTEFKFSSQNWKDPDGISEFHFYYSFDDGETYLPVNQQSFTSSTIKYTFETIFSTKNVMLKCQVTSIKGFSTFVTSTFLLIKKSSASARVELNKFTLANVNSQTASVQAAYQIQSIAGDLGKLNPPDQQIFAPKVEQCSDSLCSFNGDCIYDSFSKKYQCQCYGIKAGSNCTFSNKTQLEQLKNLTLANAQIYIQQSIGTYDQQFLKLTSSQKDLMSDNLFDNIHDVVYNKVLHLKDSMQDGDTTVAQNSIEILSNMLEYLDYDQAMNNATGSWNASGNMTEYQAKVNRSIENRNRTLNMVKMIQNATLYQLNVMQPVLSFSSRMISYKQVMTSKDKILSMPATTNVTRKQTTFVKISPVNFINETNGLDDNFIAEAVQYAVNPYQIGNDDRVATNVFELNLFNQNMTVTTNEIKKVEIKSLTSPIEISFPANDNQNLTSFMTEYNSLYPYKYSDAQKRIQMIQKSGLSCVYWDTSSKKWSSNGCTFGTLDNTHFKCKCSHLSSFAITFTTPKLTVDAPLLENSTIGASKLEKQEVQVSDVVRWPLDVYFNNLGELWQHNQPSFIEFVFKPSFAILILFWIMYFSSLIYYSGRDTLRRNLMTKSQNRDDLAETKDDEVQNIWQVIRDLIVRDFLSENGKFIQKQARRMQNPNSKKKQLVPPQIKIYEQMSKDEKKKYKERARKKVFGVPGDVWQRAKRFYDNTMKRAKKDQNAKQDFLNEQIKNNYWIGLVAKTSKIAPRHVRLAMMYFNASVYITAITIIFGFQLQEYISSTGLFQILAVSLVVHFGSQFLTFTVASIFRMPLHLRRMISGVKTKKINKAFREVDAQMGCRYSIGYFIVLTMYFIMTVVVVIFNTFYPSDYVIGWMFNIIVVFLLDLIVFTFGLAGLQLVNAIISSKVKCWYHVWATIEVYRYIKNLRG